jgi:hypothetical protein
LSILQIALERKTLKKITFFSPFVVKTQKREKSCEAKMRRRLLIVLRLLVVGGLLLLIIVIVVNSRRTNAEGSQLGRSQRGVGVGMGGKTSTLGNSRRGSSRWLWIIS